MSDNERLKRYAVWFHRGTGPDVHTVFALNHIDAMRKMDANELERLEKLGSHWVDVGDPTINMWMIGMHAVFLAETEEQLSFVGVEFMRFVVESSGDTWPGTTYAATIDDENEEEE